MKKIYFSIDSLCIMPQMKKTVDVTVDYLSQLDKPVENMKMNYIDINTTDTNNDLTECSYPNINYIYIEASSMLPYNYNFKQ